MNKIYNYRLRAYNQLGWSGYQSPVVAVNTPSTPGQCAAPTVAAKSTAQIDLSWNPLTTDAEIGRSPILHYNLQWKLSTDASWT